MHISQYARARRAKSFQGIREAMQRDEMPSNHTHVGHALPDTNGAL